MYQDGQEHLESEEYGLGVSIIRWDDKVDRYNHTHKYHKDIEIMLTSKVPITFLLFVLLAQLWCMLNCEVTKH